MLDEKTGEVRFSDLTIEQAKGVLDNLDIDEANRTWTTFGTPELADRSAFEMPQSAFQKVDRLYGAFMGDQMRDKIARMLAILRE